MAVTLETIERLAVLSRITLTDEEKETMRGEFEAILGYIAAIDKIAANTAAGARSIVSTTNIMREDTHPHESGTHTSKLLAAAPRTEGDYLLVKKIL